MEAPSRKFEIIVKTILYVLFIIVFVLVAKFCFDMIDAFWGTIEMITMAIIK